LIRKLLLGVEYEYGGVVSKNRLNISSGNPAESRVTPMKSNPTKMKANAPVKRLPWTFQRFFDKWFLPLVFVGIGGVFVWAIWHSSR
jgi:hypothetical protein